MAPSPQIVTLAWDGGADSRPVHIFIDQPAPRFALAGDETEFYVTQAQTLRNALYVALTPATLVALTVELLFTISLALALPGQVEVADA